jgi:peptidoglycan L-alanyl-D-glutamate endopeptidase CwlK
MGYFSDISKERLSTAHEDLQTLFNEVVKGFDCSIICGHRDKESQDKEYAEGDSKLKWPNSKHNKIPSLAIDAVPYPELYSSDERMILFTGYVLGVAAMLKEQGRITNEIECGYIKWGWDFPHFQIKT